MLPSFLFTHQRKTFSRKLSGFSSKSPLEQAPFLCLQTSFDFPRHFGTMQQVLKSGDLVSGPPTPNSPITELFRATVFLLCQVRMITPSLSVWRPCEDTEKIEQKYPRRWHTVEDLGMEITHFKNMLFLKTARSRNYKGGLGACPACTLSSLHWAPSPL